MHSAPAGPDAHPPPPRVRVGVDDEKISAEYARRERGVVIDAATGAVDETATRSLRATRPRVPAGQAMAAPSTV